MRHPYGLMIFAAGFGTRMGALTADRPKPLITVAGRALIDRTLDIAVAAGADPIAVNLHYRGAQLADHLAGRNVHLSWERDAILETGGGLRQALPHLGDDPVATLNADAVWTGENPILQLRAQWNPARMDALLLLAPIRAARGHAARPDFALDGVGRISRHAGSSAAGYVYLGAQIIDASSLAFIPDPVFSLNRVWDGMIAAGRAFGIVHHGGWCDVGSPGGLAEAEVMLREAGDV
jgi:N-acetyl-alpha-D-muramate 1-phosphate uridylyltransferase